MLCSVTTKKEHVKNQDSIKKAEYNKLNGTTIKGLEPKGWPCGLVELNKPHLIHPWKSPPSWFIQQPRSCM